MAASSRIPHYATKLKLFLTVYKTILSGFQTLFGVPNSVADLKKKKCLTEQAHLTVSEPLFQMQTCIPSVTQLLCFFGFAGNRGQRWQQQAPFLHYSISLQTIDISRGKPLFFTAALQVAEGLT